MAAKTRKPRITPQQIDDIVALRLRGVSVRETAKRVGVTTATVQKRYKEYLAEIAADRADRLDHEREEAIARFQMAADAAWDAYQLSLVPISTYDKEGNFLGETVKPDPRLLAEFRMNAAEVAKLTGSYAPARTELTGKDGGPLELDSPAAKLAAMLDSLARTAASNDDTEG